MVVQADADRLRAGFRTAFEQKDGKTLAQLAVDPKIVAQQPGTVHLLAVMLGNSGQVPSAVKLLEDAQQRNAGDFWINFELASYLGKLNPPRSADAVATIASRCRSARTAAWSTQAWDSRCSGRETGRALEPPSIAH